MLRTAFVLVLALAALEAQAQRTLELVESSFELRLADTSLPVGGVGDVSFKTCEKCTTTTRLLTPGTQFFVGGQPVPVKSFMATATDVRQAESANPRSMIVLHVDLKTQNVNRIALVRPSR